MKKTIVVTTINYPTEALKIIASEAKTRNIDLLIVGDKKTPKDFNLEGATFIDTDSQVDLFPGLAEKFPFNHYSRKNLGYLVAIKNGSELIQETDDDNSPLASFWNDASRSITVNRAVKEKQLWCNVYSFFSEENIWPRGLPLEAIKNSTNKLEKDDVSSNAAIIQGLANGDPDVDAVYRMTGNIDITFKNRTPILLPKGLYCPFNSQNTIFFKEAFPLLYLPSYCSFRMTDIWRSFIAQRCIWELDMGIVFTPATVFQDRNVHNLLKDFEDEIPGYLLNDKIVKLINDISLTGKVKQDIMLCYETLVNNNIFPQKEIELLSSWLNKF